MAVPWASHPDRGPRQEGNWIWLGAHLLRSGDADDRAGGLAILGIRGWARARSLASTARGVEVDEASARALRMLLGSGVATNAALGLAAASLLLWADEGLLRRLASDLASDERKDAAQVALRRLGSAARSAAPAAEAAKDWETLVAIGGSRALLDRLASSGFDLRGYDASRILEALAVAGPLPGLDVGPFAKAVEAQTESPFGSLHLESLARLLGAQGPAAAAALPALRRALGADRGTSFGDRIAVAAAVLAIDPEDRAARTLLRARCFGPPPAAGTPEADAWADTGPVARRALLASPKHGREEDDLARRVLADPASPLAEAALAARAVTAWGLDSAPAVSALLARLDAALAAPRPKRTKDPRLGVDDPVEPVREAVDLLSALGPAGAPAVAALESRAAREGEEPVAHLLRQVARRLAPR
jgi:hypothetical protein